MTIRQVVFFGIGASLLLGSLATVARNTGASDLKFRAVLPQLSKDAESPASPQSPTPATLPPATATATATQIQSASPPATEVPATESASPTIPSTQQPTATNTSTPFPTPTSAPTSTPTPSPTPTLQQRLTFTLDWHDPVAGDDGWSDYGYTLTNTGTSSVDLDEVVQQSWYSADPVLGGVDDCGAGFSYVGGGLLLPGDSRSKVFGANLEPNPDYWPQCVDRDHGYAIVQIYTTAPLEPANWWAAYPVSR